MKSSPSATVASIPVLRRLLATGIITAEEEWSMEQLVRRALPWRSWLDRGLLGLGTALVLSGIAYFFAHNWDHLTNTDKLSLAGGAALVSFLAAAWRGFDDVIGKLLLLASSVLVGVFIAVFGQVYQTGADSYQLFTAWALLIFPWVVLGRFMPLWILWVAVLNFAWGFYAPILTPWLGIEDLDVVRFETVGLALLNGAALLIREIMAGRGRSWFDRGWVPQLLLTATMAPASIAVVNETFRTWDPNVTGIGAWIATIIFAGVVLGLGWFYARIRHSLAALAVVTLAACTTLTFQASRILDFTRPEAGAAPLLAEGLLILLIFGAGVFFLRSQRQANQS
jgi:uncharacterized membrane protein